MILRLLFGGSGRDKRYVYICRLLDKDTGVWELIYISSIFHLKKFRSKVFLV